jgi:hypothetical protein
MIRSLRAMAGGALLAALLGAVLAPATPPAIAQERPTEAEELRDRAEPLLRRMPDVGRLLIAREIDAWDGLKPPRRNRLERWIDLLLPLDAQSLEELFAPAMAVAADQRSQRAAELLDEALLTGPPSPPDLNDRRVVIVCVGGGSVATRVIERALATEGPIHPLMPQTMGVVRPWGTLLTKFSARLQPDFFLGMLLQGRNPALDPRGGSKVLATPSIGEMYRKTVGRGETGRDVWVIYRKVDVVADFSTAKAFGEKYAQIAVYADRMENLAKVRIEEEVLEYRRDGKPPLDVTRHMHGLSAGKLRVDTLYADKQVQEFVRGQVARASGPGINSDVFVARATADLLRSAIHPRIVIARLGGPEPGPDGRIANKDRDRFVQDTDRHIGMIWSASRAADRWRGRTYFWLIVEGGSVALVSGPDIAPGGRSGASAKLTQVVPTVAKMLGLNPEEMAAGAKSVSKKPIEDLFK